MFSPELIAIVDRIATSTHTDADIQVLRQALCGAVAAGERSVAVQGNANGATITTGNGNTILNITFQADGVQIDDRHYQGAGAEALRAIIQEILRPTLEIGWQQVSRSFLDEQLRLTTNPLTAGEGISYRTEQVYVPLGLVERKRQTRRGEDVSPEQGSLLYEEVEITQRFENEQFLEQVLQQRQSPKSRGKRIAIIGEPGAGKTTLLQQIAQWVSEHVEGAIAIWVSLADLRGQELEPYLLERWLQATVRRLGQAEASDQVKDAFAAQFQQGRVWLLLDGVDEMQMPSGNPLSEIERQVRMGGLLSQARIVLSCRLNLWDGNRHALLDTFDTYRTLEFSYPQQVEQFIEQWFGALQEAQEGQAERLCAALKATGKERIRDLVKNPLRLTLLCFDWHLREGTLPETKAGLYEQFVADFYEWKRKEFPTTAKQRRQLNAALGELAREAIDKETTRFRLQHDFVYKFLGEPNEKGSLFQLALQLGWLNKVGVDAETPRKAVYAFFHPTFQEYLTALAIDDWHYFLNHIPGNPYHPDSRYRIFESQWKEVFLLWLGRNRTEVANEQKEEFIQALLGFEDGCGKFYSYQAYFLAALGTTEFIGSNSADTTIEQLIKWSIGYFDTHKNQWRTFLEPIAEEATAKLCQTEPRKTINALVSLFQSDDTSTETKRKAAEVIGKIRISNQEAIIALTDLLDSELDSWSCCVVARSLAQIDPQNTKAIQILTDLILEETDPSINLFAAGCLREMNIEDCSEIINTLREMLSPNYYKEYLSMKSSDIEAQFFWAAKNLLAITPDNQEAIEVLMELLCKEHLEHEWIRISAIGVLPSIKTENQKIIHLCNELLLSEPNGINRCYIARVLGIVDFGNQNAIQVLLDLLQSDNLDVCSHAVSCLEDIGSTNTEVINALTKFLNWVESNVNQDGFFEWLRWRTAKSLGQVDIGNSKAITVLTNILKYSKEYCEQAANNLNTSLRNDQMYEMVSQLRNTLELSFEYGYENEAWEEPIREELREFLLDIYFDIHNFYRCQYKVLCHCAHNMSYPAFYSAC